MSHRRSPYYTAKRQPWPFRAQRLQFQPADPTGETAVGGVTSLGLRRALRPGGTALLMPYDRRSLVAFLVWLRERV